MNIYNQNLINLLDRKGISLSEFENIIYIPKLKIMNPGPDELIKIADYFRMSIDTLVKIPTENLDRVINRKNIKLIILDVDGTMTDGGMYYSENGDQMKKYNTKDGMAIKKQVKKGMKFGIISHGYKQKVVQDRADLLGIQYVYVGQEDKLTILNQWCEELQISLDEVAYIGDDINDLKVMQSIGLSACPSDAVRSILNKVDIVLSRKGGDACIREFIDDYIELTE